MAATVVSFDWGMSALRTVADLSDQVELPVERQRDIGWTLMSRVAEQQLRRGGSVVLDLVARDVAINDFADLADRSGAGFSVIECFCEDEEVHRARVEGRTRDIPGWYELKWEHVQVSRRGYVALAHQPKLVLSALDPIEENLTKAFAYVLPSPPTTGTATAAR
jgi:hypothetical protein